ncbi:MAG: hypothetical protein ACFE91_09260 [Promethearchaeota archaeon]
MRFRNLNHLNQIILIFLIILCIFLISNSFIYSSHAQTNGEPYTINPEFKILGFGETSGEILNNKSIEFPITSEMWNLTNIKLNITNFQSQREIRDIETDIFYRKDLYKGKRGYAVQLSIIDTTEIYAVHIYGYEYEPITTTNIIIQINGYDSNSNIPNETIYASTQINKSSDPKWYIQNFSSPVILTPGNYSLVMNGTQMLPSDNGNYYWYFTNNPNNPNLYVSEWDKDIGQWLDGYTGEPFLYKLDQKVIDQFNPEEINMNAEIGGINYSISNGMTPGSGFLNESVNFTPSDHNINIPISINKTLNLIFNLSYNLKFETLLTYIGSGLINQDFPIEWTLTPLFERFLNYQFYQFYYSKNWNNVNVYQKQGEIWENRTSDIFIVENSLIIPNNTLNDAYEWKITASSPNIAFNLNLPSLEWNPGEELQFNVSAPVIEGNLTFFLINSLGFGYENPIETREVVSEDNIFYYEIPSNSREGIYTILIYWNNNTDAGIQSKEFQLIKPPEPFTIDPIWILVGILSTIGASVLIIFSYITIKKYRFRRIERAEKLFNKCMDALNLEYIIVSEKKSGLNLYQQKFIEREIDASMISGFLQAIHSFGIELMKIEDRSQTIKLEYKGSIILMTEFVNLRLILLMKESPSRNFLYSVEDLAFDIYRQYGKIVDAFNGDVKPFRGIEDLLKQHLNTSFVYPLEIAKIEQIEKIRVSQSERFFINKAVSLMKQNNKDFFFTRELFPENACSPKDIEVIQGLINKKIFQVHTPKSQKFK